MATEATLTRILAVNIGILLLLLGVQGASWSHSGEDTWHNDYPTCSGNHQSPINIDTNALKYSPTLTPFKLTGFDSMAGFRGNLDNNGHSANIHVEGSRYVEAGGLAGTYKTAQFHFHWGSHELQGAEHTIDDKQYPLEMHIVNYAIKYGDLSTAVTQSDGLAVLGIMFRISPLDNPYFDDVVQNLAKITNSGPARVPIDFRFPLRAMLPGDITQFYRYSGSLTTPGCYESVAWTVFHEAVPISPSQLREFRTLLVSSSTNGTAEHVIDNFRRVQPLNDRIVYTTQETFSVLHAGAASSLERCKTVAIFTVIIALSSALYWS